MRQIFLTLGLCISMTSLVNAQNNYDSKSKTWSVSGYSDTAAISFENGEVKVQKGGEVLVFPAQENNHLVQLINPNDSTALLNALNISPQQIAEDFQSAAGAGAAEKLLTFVKNNGNKLVLAPLDGEGPSIIYTTTEEGAVTVEEAPKESNVMRWLIPLLTAILGTGIGIAIGRSGKKETRVMDKQVVVEKGVNEEPNPEIALLKQDIQKIKKDNAALKEKTNAMVSGDKQYYNSVFEKVILPLEDAINKGDEKRMAQLLQIAAAQLSSVARTKLSKKQKFDEANLQYIMGNPTFSNDYKSVGKDVPMDKIPAQLRTVIAFLQKHGVTELDDTIILGHKIRNI